jgi:uncharacterized protein (TIGR03437 family)
MVRIVAGRAWLLLCAGWVAAAQNPFDNAALSGKYHFVQLLVSAPSGETRTLAGWLAFDGQGAFTYAAEGTVAGQGTYSVGGAGNATLTSPIRNVEYLSAYLSADREVLIGSSTFAAGVTYDLFVAVRAPASSITNAVLNGAYTGAWVEFRSGSPPVMKSGLVYLTASGGGRFTRAAVVGHASDAGGRTVAQVVADASYSLRPDGTGTAVFGAAASLLAGDRQILVSEGGAYWLAALAGRGILVAVRDPGAAAAFDGRYWIAELTVDAPHWSAAAGSLRALPGGRALLAERIRMDGRAVDFAGLNSYAIAPDGTGALAPRLTPQLVNLALGASLGGRAGAFVGAQIGPLDSATTQYGLFFGVRARVFEGSGVFLDPAGVVNGASFASLPHPVAPGAAVSLFGSGLAARDTRATAFPLPTQLDDVTVTVNGAPAPLYFVSPTQAGIQLPYGLTGGWVNLRLTNSRGASNQVTAPLAATSPGVFFWGDYRGIVLHADYSLITAEKPAKPGETVMIWLTGLGELRPAVAAGAANPASPLAWAVDAPITALFGGEPATRLDYAGGAPGFPGLNQINATIPLNAPVGPAVPVAISTGNAYVDLVDIPISR